MSHSKRLGALAITAMAWGCGAWGCSTAAADDDPLPPAPTPCSAADIDTCRVNQEACTMTEGAPTCSACGAGTYASETGSCEPIPGTATSHDFAEFTTAPGSEVLGQCQSWTLHNEADIWVNAVEL